MMHFALHFFPLFLLILSFIIFLDYLKSLAVSERVSLDVSRLLLWCVLHLALVFCHFDCSCCVLFKLDSFLLPFSSFWSITWLLSFIHSVKNGMNLVSILLDVLNIILVPPYVPTEPPRGHGDGKKYEMGRKTVSALLHSLTKTFAFCWDTLRPLANFCIRSQNVCIL